MLSTTGNLTVCWTGPPDEPPDGYHITSQPLLYSTPTSLWINQSSPGARWVNQSVCVDLGGFTPGQTYEIGVVSVKGEDRSESTGVKHTTGKREKSDALFARQVQSFIQPISQLVIQNSEHVLSQYVVFSLFLPLHVQTQCQFR